MTAFHTPAWYPSCPTASISGTFAPLSRFLVAGEGEPVTGAGDGLDERGGVRVGFDLLTAALSGALGRQVSVTVVLALSTTAAVRSAVLAGARPAVLSELTVAEDIAARRLARFPTPGWTCAGRCARRGPEDACRRREPRVICSRTSPPGRRPAAAGRTAEVARRPDTIPLRV